MIPKSSTLTQGLPSARCDEKEVRGLEVAVDHAERVRLGQRLGGLEHVVDRELDGEAPLVLEELLEVLPLRGTP